MAWKFKDRYMPGEIITIPFEITKKLHKLNDTLDAYRWYELLSLKEREQTIGDGGTIADILTKHVMCAYYIGWFDIEDDEAFENYKKDFRKFFIYPHPAFAACRFAACLGFIRHQRKLIEECEFLSSVQEGDSIFTNKNLIIENQNLSWD
ncbi:hypothetical protein [Pseudomonas helleri]|uniref:Uncharacterized protein n=1 Tax=Pseudomonas helleri TaxID=1608996 RepID=A0A6L5HPQ9_9PSED|nr:hypothetical protein [Pseudomonas helleri]MQU04425.1 hypothetical protein [Pseudomonas helleri]